MPGPTLDDDRWPAGSRFDLLALDPTRLTMLDRWRLAHRPRALAPLADGTQAYVLADGPHGSTSGQRLVCLDLATGSAVRDWPLPDGCFTLAASGVGKVYVPDAPGDRVWAVDTRTGRLLGSIPMPGALISVAARAV